MSLMADWVMSVEGATVGVLVITLVVLYFLAQARQRKHLPPGPPSWPVVGNLVGLALAGMPHIYLAKLASKYGGLMYLQLGSKPCVVVSTVAAVKEMFQKSNDGNFSTRFTGLFFGIMSNNFKTIGSAPHGPYWRHLRRFSTSKLFSPKCLASYQNMRKQELEKMMKSLAEDCAKGQPEKNVRNWFRELDASVMTRMLFNKSGDACREEKVALAQAIDAILTASVKSVLRDYIPSLRFLNKLQGIDKATRELRDRWLGIGAKFVDLEKRRERMNKESSRIDDDQYVPDFVDTMLAEPVEDGKPMSDTTLVFQILEFLLAGTDPAATAAEWAMAETVANPTILRQARDELDSVVGPDRLMQESDIPKLPFLAAIVKETLRLHNTAPLYRQSHEPAHAMGYDIPAGSQLTLNVSAIHRDPAVYENPDEFDPRRFLDRDVNHLSGFGSYELIPFGVGRRMCPGAVLANTMVSLMLGNLLRGYEWELPEGRSLESFRRGNKEERFGLSICRKEPVVLVARPREHVVAC